MNNLSIIVDKQYHDWIDLAKGIGIFLVVVGHGLFPCHYAIDVFHMPLFFFIAGFTFRQPQDMSAFVMKKIKRIGIPYVFFAVTTSFIMLYPGLPGGGKNGPLWFFQTIFTATLLYALLRQSLKANHVSVACILFSVLTYFLVNNPEYDVLPFALSRALEAVVFMHLGYLYAKTPLKYTMAKLITAILLYVIGLYVLITQYDAKGLFLSGEAYSYNYAWFYITSLSGIIAAISFSQLVKSLPLFNWFGKNSLVIMCTHFQLMEWVNVQISQSPYYSTLAGKCVMGLLEYALALSVSAVCVFLCKKYMPKLAGYK